jgi:hypothetical protein
VRRAIAVILSAAVIAVAACGGASKPNPLGAATGHAFVRGYSTVRFKLPETLAQDFRLWADANVDWPCSSAPPAHRLSASERSAAAGVVIRWARHEVALGELPPNLSNGQSVTAYLQAHGVR